MTEPKATPTSQRRVATVLSRELTRRGLTAKDVSIDLDRGKDWLSSMLRGDTKLPIGAIEAVARYLGLPLHQVFAEAFPDPEQATDARALVATLAPASPEPSELPADRRRQVRLFLDHRPKVNALERPDFGTLHDVLDQIWTHRREALDFAVFHLTSMMEAPRRIQTFAAGLAILSDLLRTLRVNAFAERAKLLERAYTILDRYPHAAARAIVDEKAAYLLWNLTSQGTLVARLLEQPELIAHPFPERLLASRAQFHATIERHEIALAYSRLAIRQSARPIATACAHSIEANSLHQLGRSADAVHVLDEAKTLAIPQHLQLNLDAIRARILLASGKLEQGRSSLLSILQVSSYSALWPDKAGYAALDFLEASPPADELRAALPLITKAEQRLNPNNRVEAAILGDLSAALAATTVSRPAQLRRVVDPNG
ncbi:MAG: hypothetical protein AAGE94_02165 [Acidobacteriota bacterium]